MDKGNRGQELICRHIMFIGEDDRPSPMECTHVFGAPYVRNTKYIDDLEAKCTKCRHHFMVVKEDERNRPAEWWRKKRLLWQEKYANEPNFRIEENKRKLEILDEQDK